MASATPAYRKDDYAAAERCAVVIEDHLDRKAKQLVAECRERALLYSYSNDATSFLVRARTNCAGSSRHAALQRRGRKLQEFLCQRGVLKGLVGNELKMAILQRPPVPRGPRPPLRRELSCRTRTSTLLGSGWKSGARCGTRTPLATRRITSAPASAAARHRCRSSTLRTTSSSRKHVARWRRTGRGNLVWARYTHFRSRNTGRRTLADWRWRYAAASRIILGYISSRTRMRWTTATSRLPPTRRPWSIWIGCWHYPRALRRLTAQQPSERLCRGEECEKKQTSRASRIYMSKAFSVASF